MSPRRRAHSTRAVAVGAGLLAASVDGFVVAASTGSSDTVGRPPMLQLANGAAMPPSTTKHRSHGAGLQRLACWLQGAGPFWLQGARRNIVSGAVRSPDTGTSAGQPVVPGGQSVSGDDAGPWY